MTEMLIDHSDHGRDDTGNGPADPDCPCRATPNELECAETGCGFCRAAISMRRTTTASPPPKPIDRFIDSERGAFFFLSNFFPIEVQYDDVLYRSVEHAYQAAKSPFPEERKWVERCVTAGQAKRAGRRVTMRDDWETARLDVMEFLLRQKFAGGVSANHSALAVKLADTFPRKLIEGNNWHDRFWGCCADKTGAYTDGENHLGKLLMKIRDETRDRDRT